jgi:hypothetical protein
LSQVVQEFNKNNAKLPAVTSDCTTTSPAGEVVPVPVTETNLDANDAPVALQEDASLSCQKTTPSGPMIKGPFGRAPAPEPELFLAGALPKGLAKWLLTGIRRERRSLEHLGRGGAGKPTPAQLHRLLPSYCHPCPRWEPDARERPTRT